jgi:copper homeostasis protein
MTNHIILEIAVQSVRSAISAVMGGADRLELCQSLESGGLTPSCGLIEEVIEKVSLPVHILIRPRPGDFIYTSDEISVMKKDILAVKERGAHGIVIGALKQNGDVDSDVIRQLIDTAQPLSVTFHRAFDFARDPLIALEDLCKLRIDRLLTSGQKPSVTSGWPLIKKLVELADKRIIILAGGGISPGNVKEIIRKSGVSEIHCSAKRVIKSPMTYKQNSIKLGSAIPSAIDYWENDTDVIRDIRRITKQSS